MHLLVPLAMLLALGAVVGVRRGAGTALSRLCRPTLSAVDDDTMEALLITPSELARRLDEPGVVVIEVVSPADAAKDPLRIPGSQRVWRPNYELPVCEPDQPFVGLAPTPAAFTELAQGLGIDDDSEVVILSRKYDETRLWWLFVACGKRSVRLLDGGYSAWLAAECPTTADAPAPRPRGTWTANPLDARLLASMDDVAQLRDASAARLWDVRTAEEYAGSTTMPGAVRPGRIPWATRRMDWDVFRASDGTWLAPHAIRALAEEQLHGAVPSDGEEHVFYCQSGVRTTQLIFGMHRAGWPLRALKNYDGSWVEWSARSEE